MEHKGYYAILPANVRYDTNLSSTAKLLYAEITALSNLNGYCWATNSYFAKLYNVTSVTISRIITQLSDRGYIRTEIIYKENSKEIDKRVIYIAEPINNIDNTYNQKVSEPINENVKGYQQKCSTPINKNDKENTNNINIKKNNNIYRSNEQKSLRNDFEKLWKLYPNKKGKEAAFKAYCKAIESGTSNKEIQNGIIAYQKEIAFKNTNPKYIKHGSTWFNNQCWNDEYEQPPLERQAIENKVIKEELLSEEQIKELMGGLSDGIDRTVDE
ncbi:helix-turn-helix domain-containing protein [Globicatella sp. PHS-GS-PNBC-21-1553]|uniref:helix-turn-helix domain-containing protein n=1 Tax=Globicatella sp. PHS-GS-PNBC-21-1553 TaxID=2885764 RepID=UPI00298F3703|nr:helix-turn-helix domain-containing protein [Globicatella sp. PHS-GS-PNBC-21-1553]WPC08777.1 helix-turn-helix domain-containing protein [Globicatella sp. PHS-GS-PNBC-21-1553]